MCGMVGGLVGNASQKMTHAFPDLSVQFPCVSSSLIRNITSVKVKMSAADCCFTDKQSIQKWTQTNANVALYKYQLACWNMLRVKQYSCMHAGLIHEQNHLKIYGHTCVCCVTITHTQRNSTQESCAQSIVVTIIQHMWLICPWQFPSWLGEGLQRKIEQSRVRHMTSPDQTIAATNTQDKCQHFDQSSLPFCFYQHTPAQ